MRDRKKGGWKKLATNRANFEALLPCDSFECQLGEYSKRPHGCDRPTDRSYIIIFVFVFFESYIAWILINERWRRCCEEELLPLNWLKPINNIVIVAHEYNSCSLSEKVLPTMTPFVFARPKLIFTHFSFVNHLFRFHSHFIFHSIHSLFIFGFLVNTSVLSELTIVPSNSYATIEFNLFYHFEYLVWFISKFQFQLKR